MRPKFVVRLIGLFLLLFSVTLVPPALIALFTHDGEFRHFAESILILSIPGLLLWYPMRSSLKGELRTREAFVVVALFWVLLGTLGSLPLILGAHLNVTDAVFEAVSGFTTTGATVIVGIDKLPPSILMYRAQLQWFGGLGVIVLAVAILPMLGIGGMQLYRAETPGPIKDEKITPRIAHTARFLWIVYVSLTVACALAYYLAGMSVFDAIAHSFATLATGGFSTHDASLAYYHSPPIEIIATVFMFLGGISFSVHFLALMNGQPRAYWSDPQSRAFLAVVAALIGMTALGLFFSHYYSDILTSLRYAAFEVVSVITTTGFGTADFSVWPVGLPLLLMLSGFIGGCAGSTGGGMKVIRFQLLAKVGWRQILRLIHPAMVRPIRLGTRPVPNTVLDAVWGFFSVYVVVFVVIMLAVMATGVDQVTAFGAVATCINNVGPGLGDVAITFASVNPIAKWLCTLAMLLGRLEIFTLLVLLSPTFWRK